MNIENYPVVYEGSVKNLREVKKATKTNCGKMLFEYTDDFSIFDWGKMPNKIEGKGKAMAILAADIFENINRKVDYTHYVGVLSDDGKVAELCDLKRPSNVMIVDSVRVLKPNCDKTKYGTIIHDYSSIFINGIKNYLIPLENVFRFGVPKGSSLLERVNNSEYLKEIGLSEGPKEGEWLPHIVFEYFTKLENGDRHLNLETALNYSGLNLSEFFDKQRFTKKAANFLKKYFERIGLELWDCKLEYAKDNEGNIMMVDAIGLDELRLIKDSVQISKEPLRQWYKKNDERWYNTFKEATKKYGDAKKAREECRERGITPKNMNLDFLRTMESMYKAVTNECTGREWFKEIPSLDKIVKDLKKWI